MAIDKRLQYDRQMYALGQRVNFKRGGTGGGTGDAGSPGTNADGSNANSGGNGDANTNRERGIMSRGLGPKGTTGSISGFDDGPGVDRSAVSQFSNYGRNVMNQNLQGPNTNKFGGILSGLLGLINPAFGLLSKGLGFLGTKAQDLRGYNPDGTPRTQAEYEEMVADRKTQTSIDNILGRDAPITEMTQRNLEKLGYTGGIPGIGSTPTSRAIARDLAINPEQPQFARSYLNSISASLPNIQQNVPSGIQSIDVGYDDPAFTNDLMAEITQQDINKSKMRGFNSMDYNTAIDLGIISPNVTGYEFDQLQKGNITEPGTYTA